MIYYLDARMSMILLLVLIGCNRNKPVQPNGNISKNVGTEESDVPSDDSETIDKSGSTEKLASSSGSADIKILDIKISNLVDAESNLPADTEIGLLEVVTSNELGEEIVFRIKEQGDSDYSKFRLENNVIFTNEEIVGDRRFILYLEAQSGSLNFEKSVIFSISAGQIPPEIPRDLLLSSSTIDENNQENDLIGSMVVVDDSRFKTYCRTV